MPPIRIFLLSESRLLREAFAHTFHREPDLLLVGDCSQLTEALARIAQSPCDVLLTDSRLPQWNAQVINDFRSSFPSMRIILLNADCSESSYWGVTGSQIAGYLFEESSIADVIETVRWVARGEIVRSSGTSE
jgi:DNA-binding NarL/FixJ family response regulator